MWNVEREIGIGSIDFDKDVSIFEGLVDVYTMTCEEEKNDEYIKSAFFQMKIEDDAKRAKDIELDSWREQGVYEEVQDKGQSCITTRWVLKMKVINGQESWMLNSIDVKTAFLQAKIIQRTAFVCPPKEAKTNKIWGLRKCIYGLADAPRQRYLRVREEFIKLKA